jgi:hypothetical protein
VKWTGSQDFIDPLEVASKDGDLPSYSRVNYGKKDPVYGPNRHRPGHSVWQKQKPRQTSETVLSDMHVMYHV